MKKIRFVFEKVENVFINISLISVFVMMLAIFADVTMRYVFNSPIPGIMEISGDYFMILIVYFGISYTHRVNGHVKADVLESKLSRKMRAYLNIFKGMLITPILSLMCIASFNLFIEYLENDIRSVGSLEYLIAPAYLVMAIGLLLIIIRLILNIIDLLFEIFKKNPTTSITEGRDEN